MRLSRQGTVGLLAPGVALLVLLYVAPELYFLRYAAERPSTSSLAVPAVTASTFTGFFRSSYDVGVLWHTVLMALATTVVAFAVALPVSYVVGRTTGRAKTWLVVLAVLSMLVGNVVRSIGWSAMLGYGGIVNRVGTALHLLGGPQQLSDTYPAVIAVLVSVLLPVMILTLESSFGSLDRNLERASRDLGAAPFPTFWRVTLPQVVPGILAGTSIVFVLSLNAYAIPALIGGPRVPTLATVMYASVTQEGNYPVAAVIALLLLIIGLAGIGIYSFLLRRQFEGWRTR
jgi:putative spermidine/putrescine transport system permease protein